MLKVLYFLGMALFALVVGDVIQTTSLNWFASSIVGNIPILGDYLTFLDIKEVFDAMSSQNRADLSVKEIAAFSSKLISLAISFLAWYFFSVMMGGASLDDGSSLFKGVKIFSLCVWNLLLSFLLIAVLHTNIFNLLENTIERFSSSVSL